MSEDKNKVEYNKVSPQEEEVEEVVVEREVVTQKVQAKPRKKGLMERLVRGFMDTDGEGTNIGTYLMREMIGPAMKDLIVQSGKAAIDKIAYGRTEESYREDRRRSGGANRHAYDSYSSSGNRRRDDKPSSRNSHEVIIFEFDTRHDAQVVLEDLRGLINTYTFATVSDYYDLIGAETSFTHSKYGWYSLNSAQITNYRGKFTLRLPEPEVVI